ncbi:hypothetical protein SAMN05192529_13314 [Arachidicoccus rhizosphaerae]|uniref:PH domain-containing protein n=1 Tax=Arachidicoccus rhizosphaerae TaxID=551991 RepID=A0A1H4CL94_9BACT|nr:hypothetical protein [Arachidicoccus rhizosphaerae]SEA61205.1 hypothetical protein SAMN05192529_13314 [Arachidicoccus rhizosphaerae]
MEKTNYRQSRKIFNPWFICSFLPVFAVCIYLAWDGARRDDTINIICAVSTFTISGTVLLLLLLQKMTLITGPEEISYNYFPVISALRKIPWAEIHSIQIITYNPLRDFGGWGFKVSKKYGKGYTTTGNTGLWIKFTAGGSVFLSIINPDEVAHTISLSPPVTK